jgi:prepilin-type N-terminal cleavage/methylation domain-containing protein
MHRTRLDVRTGFVLVELMIAIGVFLVVATIAVGGFARSLRTIRQNAALVSASGNTSLALEQMTREMRTGYDFCTNGQVCTLPDALSFKNAKGDVIQYSLVDNIIVRTCTVSGGTCDGDPGDRPITPATTVIKSLSFVTLGTEPGDKYQPRVTITVGVTAKEAGLQSAVTTFQTTVSSRLPLDS